MTVDSGAAATGTAQTAGATAGAGEPGRARAEGLWAERTGPLTYTGHNARGASVRMGPVGAGDVFTPGELLKVALAGCAGMSADHSLARRLGKDVPIRVNVAGPKHGSDEHYPVLHEELVVDLSGLPAAEQERVITIVRRAIDRNCTVGRTLERGAGIELTVGESGIPAAVPLEYDGATVDSRTPGSAGQTPVSAGR